ncbi:MAG TPA: response regulator [Ktedonobacterales bacterium]|jgi:DNA-binding response OmpR family regulator|nr:response regulator [Ktedonobacterales bacterium]
MACLLLVEDEEPLRRILARNLSRRGYRVAEAGSAADAIAALRAGNSFDALLLDVNLPDQTGWDVLRALKAANADAPPVVVLTAVRPMRQRLDEFHPAAVLLKPFPVDALVRLVGRVTGSPLNTADTSASEPKEMG